MKLRAMIDVRTDEPALLFGGWIHSGIAYMRSVRIVVIVAPFREVICEFKTNGVGRCVLEINDDELFV